ncbi:MAG: PAS domain S-box protein [bacterium]
MRLEDLSARVADHIADGIVLENSEGIILYVNPALEKLLAYQAGELINRHWTTIVPDDQRILVESANVRRLQGETDRYEMELLHRDGNRILVLITGTPYAFEEGTIGMLSVITDISALRAAEKEVERLRAFYGNLVDAMADGVVVEDSSGHFTFVNPAMAKLLGTTPEKLIGTHWTNTIDVGQERVVRDAIKRRKGGHTEVYELTLKRQDGKSVTGLVTAQPFQFNEEEKEMGVLSVFRDITELRTEQEEKRHLSEQFLASQKMETIGRLAGGVAHDFNNLLSIIKGQADMAIMTMSLDEPVKASFDRILKTVRRASDLVRQLLMFSRRQYHDPRPLVLDTLLADMERLLRPIILTGVNLQVEKGETLWEIKADPGQIEHAVVNLAVNANDAMPHGGILTLKASNQILDKEFIRDHPMVVPGEYVLLMVSDTGIGMTKEVLAKVFDPFFTTKEEGKGTGLGLSSVYGIVKQHDGYIFVDSTPNEGTTFRIYFPRAS